MEAEAEHFGVPVASRDSVQNKPPTHQPVSELQGILGWGSNWKQHLSYAGLGVGLWFLPVRIAARLPIIPFPPILLPAFLQTRQSQWVTGSEMSRTFSTCPLVFCHRGIAQWES